MLKESCEEEGVTTWRMQSAAEGEEEGQGPLGTYARFLPFATNAQTRHCPGLSSWEGRDADGGTDAHHGFVQTTTEMDDSADHHAQIASRQRSAEREEPRGSKCVLAARF